MNENVPHDNALEAFFWTIGQFKRLAIPIGLGVSVPFVAGFASMAPPSPTGVEAITAIVEILALMVAFQFLYKTERAKSTWFFVVSLVSLILFSVAYLLVEAFMVFEAGPSGVREIAGFQCLNHIKDLEGSQCPFVPQIVLQKLQYDPQAVWTKWSISTMNAVLPTIWFAAFASLSLTFGSFVVFQSGQNPRIEPSQR